MVRTLSRMMALAAFLAGVGPVTAAPIATGTTDDVMDTGITFSKPDDAKDAPKKPGTKTDKKTPPKSRIPPAPRGFIYRGAWRSALGVPVGPGAAWNDREPIPFGYEGWNGGYAGWNGGLDVDPFPRFNPIYGPADFGYGFGWGPGFGFFGGGFFGSGFLGGGFSPFLSRGNLFAGRSSPFFTNSFFFPRINSFGPGLFVNTNTSNHPITNQHRAGHGARGAVSIFASPTFAASAVGTGAVDPSSVPEPGTLAVLAFGTASLAVYGWRRRRQEPDYSTEEVRAYLEKL